MRPKYKVIYADCPWSYADQGCQGTMANHYMGLSVDILSELPISDLVDRDAVLFLWAAYPFLKEAIQVGESWGFKYKTIAFQWVKLNRKALTPFYGLGRWTRGNTEPCLLFTGGKPHRVDNSVSQLVCLPRLNHSQRPPEVAEQIVQLMGDVPSAGAVCYFPNGRLGLYRQRDQWGGHPSVAG